MPDYRNAPALPCPAFPGSHLVLDADYVFVSGLTAADIPGGDAGRVPSPHIASASRFRPTG